MSKFILYTDGSCQPNPGVGTAYWLFHSKRYTSPIFVKKLGDGYTNNRAEFVALICGLSFAKDKRINVSEIRVDSRLVERTMNGYWNLRNRILRELHEQAVCLFEETNRPRIVRIKSEDNLADPAKAGSKLELITLRR